MSDLIIDQKDPELSDVSATAKSGFDPYKKADMISAEKHRQAHLIRKIGKAMVEGKTEKCECCGFPIGAEKFDVNCPLIELSELGSGFPLYFVYAKILGLVLLLGVAMIGIPCIIGNRIADNGDEWQTDKDSWIVQASVANNGHDGAIMPFWQCILHVVYMILIIICYHIAKRILARKDKEFDMMSVTAKDYTVHVYGMGSNITAEEVKEFFEKNGRADDKPCKVVNVNFPYKISGYIENTRRVEEINENLQMVEEYTKEGIPLPRSRLCKTKDKYNVGMLKAELEVINKEIEQFEKDQPAGVGQDLLIGQAFVTFEKQSDARAVELRFGKGVVYRFWMALYRDFCCILIKFKQSFKLKNKSIYATVANEPTDIYWENLEISFKHRIINSIKIWLVSFMALSITFGMVYGMKILGENEQENYARSSENDSWKIRILSIWPSIGIIMINFILARSTRYFTSFERPHSVTAYNLSVSIKLTIAMFFNTAIITLIVNYEWDVDWFKPSGLITDATYILISNAIVSPLLYYFSPLVCIHRLKMKKVEKARYISQLDANLLFENPAADMAQRFANICKTILLTFCYAPLIPSAFLISFAAVALEYWTFRYLLVRRHSWPKRLSGHLAHSMLEILPWGVLLYSIMNYICMLYLNPDQSGLAFIWMLIMLGYIFLPLEIVINCFFKVNLSAWDDFPSNQTYDEVALTFVDDYDRLNPVTTDEGNKRLADLMFKKQYLDEDKLKEINKDLGKSAKSVLGNMKLYAKNRKNVNKLEAKRLGMGVMALKVKPNKNEKSKEKKMKVSASQQLRNVLVTKQLQGGVRFDIPASGGLETKGPQIYPELPDYNYNQPSVIYGQGYPAPSYPNLIQPVQNAFVEEPRLYQPYYNPAYYHHMHPGNNLGYYNQHW